MVNYSFVECKEKYKSHSIVIMASSSEAADVQSLGVRSFVAARVAEITSLTTQIRGSGSSIHGRLRGFSFQHVSKHMRRRAVSHNPKRLPSRLRASHMYQLQKSSGGLRKQPRRPRRKYRKRSAGDILEYNRRQLGKPFWLESHIWHAKRFHMKALWERKLPISPTAKCFRSLFRAARNGAIMQDISYMYNLEITGPKTELLKGISAILPLNVVQYDVTKEFLGHVYSPSDSSYLGSIKYLWVSSPGQNDILKLILWVHPSCKYSVVEILILVFGFESADNPMDSFPESPTKEEQKYLWRTIDSQGWCNSSSRVSMRDLSGCLNRIRITGPKTLPVLKEILKVGLFNIGEEDEECLNETERAVMKEKQEALWSSLKRISDISSDTVVPLNVIDPRLELPVKRRRVNGIKKSEDDISSVVADPSYVSPLWDQNIRNQLLRTKISDAEIAKVRSQNLIPGTSIAHGIKPNVIPIILVFRSGKSSHAGNSAFIGADMILPMGWLMAFWIALSFRCVRVYGLEFTDYLTSEDDPFLQQVAISRVYPPDCSSFASDRAKHEKESKEKFFLRPPSKRPNLIKLGCAFPFSIDWSKFIRFMAEKNESDVEVRIIREFSQLNAIASCLRKRTLIDCTISVTDLFPVAVTLFSGTAEDRACICLPTLEDLKRFLIGKPSDSRVEQKQLKDVNQGKREELTRQHHRRMALLRKKRKAARKASASKTFDLNLRLDALDSKEESEQYNSKFKELWINDDVEDILAQQDREIIGLSTYAHYSFLRGKSAAIGYATVGQLNKLVKVHEELDKERVEKKKLKKELYVLVRNWSSSLIYNWAKLMYPCQ